MDHTANISNQPPGEKFLIVNADDLGLSPETNSGIFHAHQHGIVTSASLMVRYPAATQAIIAAKSFPHLGIGLHLDFSEWAIIDGEWKTLYEVVNLDDSAAVRLEVQNQLQAFERLINRPPTHLDSHQHVHQDSRVWPIVQQAAAALNIPLRHNGRVNYCGEFYGQDELGQPYHEGISAENLLRIIASLSAGATELACHPGHDQNLNTMYKSERPIEITSLCDPRVRDAITRADIRLIHFGEL
jgi:predicted glycoside hydrolase/deacetylase ChbG (UPF0249 family)